MPLNFHFFLLIGGVREAYFSDEYYQMLWGKRLGFAKIAIQAQVVSNSACKKIQYYINNFLLDSL